MKMYTSALLSAALLASQANAMGLDTSIMQGPNPDLLPEDTHFTKKRCTDRQLTKNRGKFDLCGDDCDNNSTDGTCTWSWPKDDNLKGKSPDKGCRCNPSTTFVNPKVINSRKCRTDGARGCPALEVDGEEGTCHWSYPWYNRTKETREAVCMYDEGDDTPDPDTPDPDTPDPDTPVVSADTCEEEGIAVDDTFNCIQLRAHNLHRAKHQNTDPLGFDQTLADEALVWSLELASRNTDYPNTPFNWEHDPNNSDGENLAWKWSSAGPTDIGTSSHATDAWYDEIADYDYGNPGNAIPNGGQIGHFTQVVWTSTTKVGCGHADGFVTCRYSPPGNYRGQYGDKVKPLITL